MPIGAKTAIDVVAAIQDVALRREIEDSLQDIGRILFLDNANDLIAALARRTWHCLIIEPNIGAMSWRSCSRLVRSGDCGSPALPIIVVKRSRSHADREIARGLSVEIIPLVDVPNIGVRVSDVVSNRLRPTLLHIEDQPVYARQMRDKLTTSFRVTSVDNGADALRIYNRDKPDIVLTDLMMPNVSGEDVVERIRNVDPSQVVVVLTAYAEAERHQRLTMAGASRFLSKSVSTQSLIKTCFELLVERALEGDASAQAEQDRLVRAIIGARRELASGRAGAASNRLAGAIMLHSDEDGFTPD